LTSLSRQVNIQEILAKELLASNSSVGHVLAAAQHPGEEEEEEEGSNWGGVVSFITTPAIF
jgi:hypothetical protein